jgi:hypothetical protein
LWDESYDALEGPPRYQAMMKIVRDIACLPPAEQLKLHQAGQSICQHNRLNLIKLVMS